MPEHAVLHLLYARFWHKVLYDSGLVSTKEPFQGLVNQGTILAESYQDDAGKYYYPHEVEQADGKAVAKASGATLQTQMEKMSKSRFNVINPSDVIDNYGADALRLYLLFIGPVTASTPWQDAGVEGVYRFLQRIWRLVIDENSGELNEKLTDTAGTTESELWRELHKTIKQVTEDTESIDKMNTAISQMMIFVNTATQTKTLPKETLKIFLHLLSPYAPHVAQELWHRLGETSFIAHEQWPAHDAAVLESATVTIIAQVNGKLSQPAPHYLPMQPIKRLKKPHLQMNGFSDLLTGNRFGRSSSSRIDSSILLFNWLSVISTQLSVKIGLTQKAAISVFLTP